MGLITIWLSNLANLELPAQKQISPSNLYLATFHCMEDAESLTLLEFWTQHQEASGKKFGMLLQSSLPIRVTMLIQFC